MLKVLFTDILVVDIYLLRNLKSFSLEPRVLKWIKIRKVTFKACSAEGLTLGLAFIIYFIRSKQSFVTSRLVSFNKVYVF